MCGWLEWAHPPCGSTQLVATGFDAATPLKRNVWVGTEARGRNQHSRSMVRLDLMLGFECVVGLSEHAPLVARLSSRQLVATGFNVATPLKCNVWVGTESRGRNQHISRSMV